MKKDQKRVGIYREGGTVKVNLHTFVGGWLICDQCHVWSVAIKPRCVNVLPHLLWGVWRWRNDTTQFASGDKELFGIMWQTIQLNRFLALYALVEGFGICWATFGLKVPILLNWVRFRPGIWDGGAISSTGWGSVCERAPTWGCLGFAPIRGSKQCGMDILPIFWLKLGSNLLIWMASLASLVILRGILVYNAKVSDGCSGWWKSLQCLSIAEVIDLECSLTLSPRALEVSPM